MSSLTSSMTVSTLMRPAMWPTKKTSVPTQTKASRMPRLSERWGTKAPLALRADAAQHHERVGEGAEKGAEGELIAAVAG